MVELLAGILVVAILAPFAVMIIIGIVSAIVWLFEEHWDWIFMGLVIIVVSSIARAIS